MPSSVKSYFPAAFWPTSLKTVSFLGAALLIGVGVAAVKAIPHGTHVPYAEAFGTVVAFIPPAIALVALLFVVVGYELEPQELRIRRLLWSTQISLTGLQRVYADPELMKCSLRIFGNGGLFAITGLYQNRSLGRYRAFVTNPEQAVALFLPERIIVISPLDPEAFVHDVCARFPHAQVKNSSTE